MKAVKIKNVLQTGAVNTPCSVQGWVRTFRANRFIALNDGSTIDNLQCVVDFERLEAPRSVIFLTCNSTFCPLPWLSTKVPSK